MRLLLALLAALLPVLAQDSSTITAQAQAMLGSADSRARAEAFLVQSIVQNPNDAAALTMLGLLKVSDLRDNPDALREQAEPPIERALAIRERDPATPASNLAFALELEAQILKQVGREGEASPLLAQALSIRKEIVRGMPSLAPVAGAVYRVGQRDGVSAPAVLQKIDPEYPESARLGKFSGSVLLSTVVDVDGTPRDITLMRSAGFGLDEKAVEALAQRHFKPGTMNGRPVPVRAQIEVNFRLL